MPKTKAAHGNRAPSTSTRKDLPRKRESRERVIPSLPVRTLSCDHDFGYRVCKHCLPDPEKRKEVNARLMPDHAKEIGRAPDCVRCGMHRDANVHLAKSKRFGHDYEDGTIPASLPPHKWSELPILTLGCDHPGTEFCKHCEPDSRKRTELRRWFDLLTLDQAEIVIGQRKVIVRDQTHSTDGKLLHLHAHNLSDYLRMVGISYEADEKLQKALLDMPVESECGLSCKGAIDAARALLTHVENATGHDYPERNEAVVKVMLHVVATYIFG